MKYLKDYKNTNTLIEIHNNEEYEKMIPLLNEVLKYWVSGKTYFKNGGYVNVSRDKAEAYEEAQRLTNYTIVQASEFLEEKEQILTIEQLIEGQYYTGIGSDISYGRDIIVKWGSSHIAIKNSWFCKKYEDWRNQLSEIKPATKEEINWLNICIQENKFIEFNEINNYMNKETRFEVGDWILTTNNAHGWGARREDVCNKILQITKIDLEDLTPFGGRISFDKIITVGKEIERKALPHEIPNNSPVNQPIKEEDLLSIAKLKYPIGTKYFCAVLGNSTTYYEITKEDEFKLGANNKGVYTYRNGAIYHSLHDTIKWAEIVKQEDNSIPEYVENICYDSRSKHKIFKTSEKHDFNSLTWKEILIDNGRLKDGTFISSTKEAYDLTNNIKVYPYTTSESLSNTYTIGIDPYKNEEIEVGDEIQHSDGHIYTIVSENPTKLFWHSSKQTTEYSYSIKEIRKMSGWKLYKKKSIHSNTTVNKQVDSPLPTNKANTTTLLRFEDEEGLFDTSVKKIKSIKTELIEI